MNRAATATAVDPGTSTTMARALSVVATLAVLSIVAQGISAGQILSRSAGADSAHYVGAIVVHVLTGLTVVAAFLSARAGRGPWWPTVLAAVVFVVGFVQAALGEAGLLAVHVPLAMVLLVGAATVMVWSLRSTRARS